MYGFWLYCLVCGADGSGVTADGASKYGEESLGRVSFLTLL